MADQSLKDVMKEVADFMYQSVVDNFTQGGRPNTWQGLRSGGASFLQRSGRLLSSIEKSSGEDWAEVGTDSIYAAIHNFGGVINWPGTSNGFGRGIKIGPHEIPMPQREFMMFQPDDPDKIAELFADKLVEKLFLTLPNNQTYTITL